MEERGRERSDESESDDAHSDEDHDGLHAAAAMQVPSHQQHLNETVELELHVGSPKFQVYLGDTIRLLAGFAEGTYSVTP